MHLCLHARVCEHACLSTHVCIRVCVYTGTYVYYMCMYIHTCIRMYVCICMYAELHSRGHLPPPLDLYLNIHQTFLRGRINGEMDEKQAFTYVCFNFNNFLGDHRHQSLDLLQCLLLL